MAFITWDPINKHATTVLTNSNMTANTPSQTAYVRATEGRTSGKWYWEIAVNPAGLALIGVANINATSGILGYTTYGRCYYASGTKYPGATAYGPTYTTGDVIGVAIDLDSAVKTIKYYKNGQPLGIAFNDLASLGEIFPFITSGTSSGDNMKATANFGQNNFNIITSNYPEYIKLREEGYLNYDLETEADFKFKFNKNAITAKNETLTLDILSGRDINYTTFKITINDIEVYSNPKINSFPRSIPLVLNDTIITNGANSVKIIIDTQLSAAYTIYYEGDGLLNPIVRDFINTSIPNTTDVILIPGKGYSLNNKNIGSLYTNISVFKKAEIKKITVNGDNDKILTQSLKFQPSFLEEFFYKNIITRPTGSRFTSMSYLDNLPIDLVAGKYGAVTDNNDTTDVSSPYQGSYTLLHQLPSPTRILYVYAKSDRVNNVKLYDINDQLLLDLNFANITYIKIDVDRVHKVRYTGVNTTASENCKVYTFKLLGYPSDRAHIFNSNNTMIYSEHGLLNSKLILEDTSSINKTIVSSRKMNRLSLLNDNTKIVIRKMNTFKNETSSKIVRSKINLKNIPIKKIEVE